VPEALLTALSDEIGQCRRCDDARITVRHAGAMNRGVGRDLMVIGIEPGNTELDTGEAFSGLAGRRLMDWLIDAGVGTNRTEILSRSHLTSICKCNIVSKHHLMRAAANCLPFLQQQIAIVNPGVCITLGSEPLRFLFGSGIELEDAVRRTWREADFGTLFQIFSTECKILPLPHPSPRSTWLNSEDHKMLLKDALSRLRQELLG